MSAQEEVRKASQGFCAALNRMLEGDADPLADDQRIQAAGDMAYEVDTEQGNAELAGQNVAIDNRVTNVYRQEEAGAWKIVHHHTDLSAAMLNVLNRLQAKM